MNGDSLSELYIKALNVCEQALGSNDYGAAIDALQLGLSIVATKYNMEQEDYLKEKLDTVSRTGFEQPRFNTDFLGEDDLL